MTQDLFGCEKYLMGPNFRIHNVQFSKIMAYLMYQRRSHQKWRRAFYTVVFQSQTLEELGLFENVQVINDHYIFEEQIYIFEKHLMYY